jgi:amino acid transporter
MQVAVMITNFSVIIFTTYTASRVKQAIARQRIIPFSRIFSRQDPYYDSPSGGLLLHWIVTVISILCVGNTASDSRQFFSGIYAYGYQFMWSELYSQIVESAVNLTFTVFLALGLFWLPSTMRNKTPNWKPTYLKNRAFLAFVAILFIAINIVILVLSSLPSNPGKVPRFYWAVSTVALVVAALTYWAILRLCEVKGDKRNRLAEKFGFYVYLYKEGDDVPDDAPDGQKFSMYEASLDGSDRRLFYKVGCPTSHGTIY